MLFKSLGKYPSGKRLLKIQQSKHYHNGQFKNLEHTPMGLQNVSVFKALSDLLFKNKNTSPPRPLPVIKVDLKNLSSSTPAVVWLGHSSFFISYNGFNILVDPVVLGNASPFSLIGQPFKGTDAYKPADFPKIDLLVLTHDHYDHLSYKTITAFKHKIKKAVTPLGVATHLEFWGMLENIIHELDWEETAEPAPGVKLTAVPSRHFSGRFLKRNNTLWTAYVLELGGFKIFLGGDSGYGTHFKTIGQKHGPFDLAILECGQYNKYWPNVHMFPEQTAQAALDLQTKAVLPSHWGKFMLSTHPWNEPIKRLLSAAAKLNLDVFTPKIGQPCFLKDKPAFDNWWNF